jgi:anti-sigma B factor antagonist
MGNSPAFAVQVRNLKALCPVVAVSGDVDLDTAPELADALATALAYDPLDLVLDLSNATLFGSSGIALLVSARNHLSEVSRLIVRGPSSLVQKTLRFLEIEPQCVVIED